MRIKQSLILGCIFVLYVFQVGCEKKGTSTDKKPLYSKSHPDSIIMAMDVSSLSMILREEIIFRNTLGEPKQIFDLLKESGINTIRLRTWVGDDKNYCADSIFRIAEMGRKHGMLIWLDLHYSNTWADPANQQIPQEWNGQNYDILKSDFSQYTLYMVEKFQPDFIQIGNEIDGGFLWPMGRVSDTAKFYGLCREAATIVKKNNPNTRIIFHISNYKNADWFFKELNNHSVFYDIGGVSYYPKWHGNNIDSLFQTLNRVTLNTGKRMIIAENSYPFTFSWADWTDNVIGWEGDLHPAYPGTSQGQMNFVRELVKRTKGMNYASGYCYWEGVWVAFDGPESKFGSPWENQACFDFSFKALPVMNVFE